MPAADGTHLRVFFIDVEGGQATLFVTPGGQSLLIDTGWPGNAGRDADRIVATAHNAGLKRLDYVLITHYHEDHVGGVPQLLARIPVGRFLDHGPLRELDSPVTRQGYESYQAALRAGSAKQRTLRPGDKLPPLDGLEGTVVSGAGDLIQSAAAGAYAAAGALPEANASCASSPLHSPDNADAEQEENVSSLGLLLSFGGVRMLDLGDLTWDKERALMCPTNKLGHVEVLIVSHHGWDHSSSPALVAGVRPRVAIMDNGAVKGGSPLTFETIAAEGAELWQLHYSNAAGDLLNRPKPFIANPPGFEGQSLELQVAADGSYSVTNLRDGFSRQYRAGR